MINEILFCHFSQYVLNWTWPPSCTSILNSWSYKNPYIFYCGRNIMISLYNFFSKTRIYLHETPMLNRIAHCAVWTTGSNPLWKNVMYILLCIPWPIILLFPFIYFIYLCIYLFIYFNLTPEMRTFDHQIFEIAIKCEGPNDIYSQIRQTKAKLDCNAWYMFSYLDLVHDYSKGSRARGNASNSKSSFLCMHIFGIRHTLSGCK